MHFRILLFLLCVSVFVGISACAPRRIAISEPTRAFEARDYVVVQTSPDRFLVLTKSNVNIKEIQKQIGCGKPHICSGQWNGEMWTIERLSQR